MPALGRTSRSKLIHVARAATLAALLVGCLPAAGLAQTGSVVAGRVLDATSGAAVRNAIVDLPGHGSTLTDEGGAFRFEGVPSEAYTLRVDAFGFAVESQRIEVSGDTTMIVEVRYQPLVLDPLVVETRLIDIGGRIRDATRDLYVVDAEVLTNQVEPVIAGGGGRFELDDVLESVPLRVVVQALGYLTLDTILVPAQDTRYDFELVPDPRIEALIEAQVARLDERGTPRGTAVLRPMDRARVLRYAGGHTAATMLEWEYGGRLNRVRCTLVNEVPWLFDWQPTTLGHILPEDIERVEFLFEGAMLRIYTREFMREMISREVELRMPIFVDRLLIDPLCF